MKRLCAVVAIPASLSFVGYALMAWAMHELNALIPADMFDVEDDFDDYE